MTIWGPGAASPPISVAKQSSRWRECCEVRGSRVLRRPRGCGRWWYCGAEDATVGVPRRPPQV
eukprot:5776709-Alexandrium_andersonii.AAC.1